MPQVHAYWVTIFDAIDEMTGTSITRSPQTALLGYTKDIPAEGRWLSALLLLLAKRLIAITWGRTRAPKKATWLRGVAVCQEQLATFWELMPTQSRPKDIWGPLQLYISAHASDEPALRALVTGE